MTRLAIVPRVSGNHLAVTLTGRIDEGADYSALRWDAINAVTFDFAGVEMMNSLGIEKWQLFFATIPKRVEVRFVHCVEPIVNAMNHVRDFLGGKSVEVFSFLAPYYCLRCDAVSRLLVERKDCLKNRAAAAPPRNCETCGNQLDFDEGEASYFRFLKPATAKRRKGG